MNMILKRRLLINVTIISTFVVFSYGAVLNQETKKLYNDLNSGRGLYNSDEKITVLNASNFKSSVYGTKNAWLVEFYNSWCGFCHRFAPIWRTLATDISAWQDVVTIGAVDCANDDNNPLCREYEIMYYPMLKFFPSDSKLGFLGNEMEKGKTVDSIRTAIVELLRKEQTAGRGASWPNLTPYRSNDVKNLWKNVPTNVQFIFLIFEDTDSLTGMEVILDLQVIKSIQIRYVTNENEALVKLMGVSMFPSIVALESNTSVTPLKTSDSSRSSFRKVIKTFLKARNIDVPKEETVVDPGEWSNIKPPDLVAIMAAAEEEKKALEIKAMGDVVFQADLEKTVMYALQHEISVHKSISGNALKALQNYLSILCKYLPIRPHGVTFLKKLRDKVYEAIEIKGEMFSNYMKELENEVGTPFSISSSQDWIGCKGSEGTFRGFPCGTWTTFHTLIVNSVLQKGDEKQFDSLEVLEAMLGYITHFFGCQDCSKHFQSMASESMRSSVFEPNDGIMWLWKAHNKVNKRLAGDASEDPLHPKIQFPSKETCPSCRRHDGTWDEEEVLKHLVKVYGKDHINQMNTASKPSLELQASGRESHRLKEVKLGALEMKKQGTSAGNHENQCSRT
uniref:Sulfhydryl oxidase n=1 Tax=Timema poppense TaxID=170557 RepID=A0A7R9CY79_TIMPO|nr:unnamed protein product [Timema poppensis]